MQTVAHDGRETAFRLVERGDGPTALYVHGSGATHRVWATQYGATGPAHPAVALDLSGHGESADLPSDDPAAAVAAYAEDVASVAAVVDADVLVGISLGGAVVLHTLLEADIDPSAVVLAGTGARLPVDDDLKELLATEFDTAVDVLHGKDVLFHDADTDTSHRSRDTMHDVGQRVVERDFLACDAFDVTDRLEEIDVPALAIVGEYDRLTPPEYHRTLAQEIQDGRYRELADAAHMAMVERPSAFNETVAAFLDDIV